MISSMKPNYIKRTNNLSNFSLIFLISLQSANFAQAKTPDPIGRPLKIILAQNETAKPATSPGSTNAPKLTGAEQTLKDEVKLEKSWIKDKKKEDSIGKLISALDQKAHEKKRVKAKKSKRISQSTEHRKIKQIRGEKTPQSQPIQENDSVFDDLFGQ